MESISENIAGPNFRGSLSIGIKYPFKVLTMLCRRKARIDQSRIHSYDPEHLLLAIHGFHSAGGTIITAVSTIFATKKLHLGH